MLVPTLALFVAAVVALAGGLIYWSNPTRVVNRAVFAGTLVMAGWLVCLHMAGTLSAYMQTLVDPALRKLYGSRSFFWAKVAYAAGALAPINFWFVKECILIESARTELKWFSRKWLWIFLTAFAVVVPFTAAFIPPNSTRLNPIYGWGFYGYYVVLNVVAPGGALDEFERSLRIADDVVRHKLLRLPDAEAARRGMTAAA